MNLRQLFDMSRKAVIAWIDDYAPSMGAAISYYTMFSLAPLLVIVIAVAGALFGEEAVRGALTSQLQGLIGREGAMAVQSLIASAREPSKGIVAGSISIALLVIGATTVFAELQSALDRIWHVPEKAKPTGVWAILRARVLSFGLIMGLAFLLMVSLMVSTVVSALGSWAGGLLPGWEVLLFIINIAISLGISTLLFAMIFKFMPTVAIRWHDVWIGAAVTAVLFEVGKAGIGLYLGKSGVSDSFAAAGSLVVVLAWVYYAAQIFLLGAEFTKVYACESGSVEGNKAVEATKAVADMHKAGTEVVDGGEIAPRPTLVYAKADDVDAPAVVPPRRTDKTTFVKQIAIVGAAALASQALLRWQRRRQRRLLRTM
ncbi:YihY/virulence factor BrkB family protein [Rhodoferax koreense]|uniref:YihY/virulence factor BrkB family protein n=1 Tax=Rhodoferax koreensis TaxID=1842727 RepID=UPI0009FABD73|nr:YihY/virulence factor BrkB family protein [Rhodoferax koreense]